MTNKLYVANVPSETTEHALRMHFSTCGGVADVELMLDNRTGLNKRGLAKVTMTSPAFAMEALTKLDGSAFEGIKLRVSDSPIGAANKAPPPTAKIVQQFRERNSLTYELDCSGQPLMLRIEGVGEKDWKIEGRPSNAAESFVVAGEGATRREALTKLIAAWNEGAVAASVKTIEPEGLLTAMADVRGI